jgi:hypothetical protein
VVNTYFTEALEFNFSDSMFDRFRVRISEDVYRVLSDADGQKSVSELTLKMSAPQREQVLADIAELWHSRFLLLRPPWRPPAYSIRCVAGSSSSQGR